MKLKNYTSRMGTAQIISKLECVLADMGVSNISKSYCSGKPTGLAFEISIPYNQGKKISFRIPVKIDSAKEALIRIQKPKTKQQKQRISEQAERTAWKILLDWIEIQCAMIMLDQAKALEIFLPYAIDSSGETFYNRLEIRGNYEMLIEGNN